MKLNKIFKLWDKPLWEWLKIYRISDWVWNNNSPSDSMNEDEFLELLTNKKGK